MDKNLIEAGFRYSGEITCYSQTIRRGVEAGVSGNWIKHEFGGECFCPDISPRGFANKACYEKAGK